MLTRWRGVCGAGRTRLSPARPTTRDRRGHTREQASHCRTPPGLTMIDGANFTSPESRKARLPRGCALGVDSDGRQRNRARRDGTHARNKPSRSREGYVIQQHRVEPHTRGPSGARGPIVTRSASLATASRDFYEDPSAVVRPQYSSIQVGAASAQVRREGSSKIRGHGERMMRSNGNMRSR